MPDFVPNFDVKRYNFRKANFNLLYELIYSQDWSFIDDFSDVNTAIESFYEKLYALFDIAVPTYKNTKSKYTYPTWYSQDLIKNIKRKHYCRKRWLDSRNVLFVDEFKTLRSTIKRKINNEYNEHLLRVQNSIKIDPKYFWNFVRSKRGGSRIPGSMTYNDMAVDSEQDIVNSFAHFFKSSFTPRDELDHNAIMPMSNNQIITLDHLSDDEVLQALKFLKPKFTSSHDNVPSFIIRDCAYALVRPLTVIFNLSLKTHCFPQLWKMARICPVFKSGDKGSINNYRAISIIPNFAKVFEKCVYNKLFFQLSAIIIPQQHGFFHKRSTVTNLACFMQDTYDALDEGLQVDTIYTDFSRAFDRVDHKILLTKMASMGFCENLILFFQSYLNERSQFVEYSGFRSDMFSVESGAPQGSNLAPLIFSIFINDITVDISSSTLLFADDLKLYRVIRSPEDCQLLQNDINLISTWCSVNRLPLNIQKCKKMTVTRKRNPYVYNYRIAENDLPDCESVRDLGVTVDSTLSFTLHLDEVVQSALRSLGFIMRTAAKFNDSDCLVTLFNSLVRSKLEYASIIWSPLYMIHKQRIEYVQRRFLKHLAFRLDGVYPARGYDHLALLRRFRVLSLADRRIYASLVFLYKLINYNIDCPDLLQRIRFHIPAREVRRTTYFYLPYYRTNADRKSPLYQACDSYNNLLLEIQHTGQLIDIHDSSLSIFKKIIVRTLSH